MDRTLKVRRKARLARVVRVRKGIKGTQQRPRLSVFKSNAHLSVQLIDDERGITLAGLGTSPKKGEGKSKETAQRLGTEIAKIALGQQIQTVLFDRGRNRYHGLVAQIADAARAAGLNL